MAAEDENADQQNSKNLEPLRQAVRELVLKYYPKGVISSAYDKKSDTDNIHFQYNTMICVTRSRDRDGQLHVVGKVRGPYVGGIWCDMALVKGRYAGDVADAERGFTRPGPDFFSRVIAPYSKKLDRHLRVTLRFPGDTSPEFLKRFDELVKDFENYVGKPAE